MGVSTTHRINLSMWILIYSFSDTYYIWDACGWTKEANKGDVQGKGQGSEAKVVRRYLYIGELKYDVTNIPEDFK